MAKSEMESPLLADQQDMESESMSPANEAYVAVPGSSEVEAASVIQQKSYNRATVLTVGICCIAVILFVSGAMVSFNSRMRRMSAGNAQPQVKDGVRTSEADWSEWSKTSFHFQPEANWMNDPNAPLYYKGFYHIFYQYNPDAATFGNISWGHAVSTDMIHWMFLDVALYPDQWYDVEGVWSGSATILRDGTPAVMYTGGRTDANGAAIQSQALAVPEDPTDPLLRTWVKVENNPVIDPPAGHNTDDFRDPTTAWLENDGVWRLLIGTKLDNEDGTKDGMALLYKSTDFQNWELEDDYLLRVNGTGMWECVDFFPVDVKKKNELDQQRVVRLGAENYLDSYKYVLKASLDTLSQDWYTIGTYSTETHKFTVDDPILDMGIGYRYDYGKFYASKSFYDISTGRRILWSWVNESDTTDDDLRKGWASVQAIPRTIWLDDKTQTNLLTWPVEEVDALRGAHVSYRNIDLKENDVIKVKGGDGPQLDIMISFEKPDIITDGSVRPENFECSQGGSARKGVYGPFGVLVLSDEKRREQTAVFFYITSEFGGAWSTRVCSDQSRSSMAAGLDETVYGSYVTTLPTEDELSLRILVDHSIVETFVQGGRMAITSRVYPTLDEEVHLFLFNNGSTPIRVTNLDVYQMTEVDMITI